MEESMGDKAKGKNKGNAKKVATKPGKGGLRPHEQRLRDAAISPLR
jgi:hypothetical protein